MFRSLWIQDVCIGHGCGRGVMETRQLQLQGFQCIDGPTRRLFPMVGELFAKIDRVLQCRTRLADRHGGGRNRPSLGREAIEGTIPGKVGPHKHRGRIIIFGVQHEFRKEC